MSNARELSELAGSYGTGGFVGMKNRIINGGMVIDQRNAGASVTSTGSTYTVDRWMGQAVVDTSKFSVQQNTSIVPPNFTVSAKITSLSAYSPTTDAIQSLKQVIEVCNIADNGWGTSSAVPMTLGFWVRSSVTGTFSGAITRANSGTVARSFVFTYAISSADTWEYKTTVISADTDSTYTYGATQNLEGVQVRFDLGSSSTKLSSTVGSWQTGNYFGATGQTSLLATNGATFYITGVQLEKGSTATSFDYRPYGTELALCQRYYWQLSAANAPYSVEGIADSNSMFPIWFPVTMRAGPTVGWSNSTSSTYYFNAVGGARQSTIQTTLSFTNTATNGARLGFGAAGALGTMNWMDIGGGNAVATFTAEL